MSDLVNVLDGVRRSTLNALRVRRGSPPPRSRLAPAPTRVPDPEWTTPDPRPLPEAGTVVGRVGFDDTRTLPPGFATLTVHRHGEDGFRLTGFAPGVRIFGSEPTDNATVARYAPARLSADELVEHHSAARPVEIIADFNTWSRGHGRNALRSWLNEVRIRQPDLHLIIADSTNLAIPWEAFRLAEPPHPGDALAAGWLGAVLPVTRWTPSFAEKVDRAAGSLNSRPACEGGVVGYFARDLRSTVVDRQILKGFLAGEPHEDGDAFIAALRTSVPPGGKPPAMVYVGAHYQHDDDPTRRFIGPFQLARMNFYEELPLISDGRTIIFLNVCRSAEMSTVPGRGDDSLYGMPDFFLRKGAAGLIGTTSKVGAGTAPDVLADLLREAADAPQTPIPQLLRRLRERADKDAGPLVDQKDRALVWRWIDTFNYVYYGHPLATFRLVSQHGP